jgi:uncharacterized alpha-E superfamily protein
LLFNSKGGYSLSSAILSARKLGSIVRDRISVDTWRVLRQIETELLDDPQSADDLTTTLGTLDQLMVPLSAFAGLSHESMTHGLGWRFLLMGRNVERAGMTTALLRALMVQSRGDELPTLDALLEVTASSITYRSRYRTTLSALPVLDLLLIDSTNPRSIAFQLMRLAGHAAELPDQNEGETENDAKRIASELFDIVRRIELDHLVICNRAGLRESLEQALSKIARLLPSFNLHLTQQYLSHAQPAASLPNITIPVSGRSIDR